MNKYKDITDNTSCTYSKEGTHVVTINHAKGERVIVPSAVENQGDKEICWAIGSGKLAETAFMKAGREHRVSIQHIVDGTYPTNPKGGSPPVALEFLKNNGVYLEKDYTVPVPPEAEKITIDDWIPVSNDERDILDALSENVLLITVTDYKSFSNLKGKALLDMERARLLDLKSGNKAELHSLLLVGAGYFVPTDQPDMKINYWIVKNSWSSEWGDEGFGYLIRNSTLTQIHSSAELELALCSPYYAYVRREGHADPDFQPNVRRGITVEELTQLLIGPDFKDQHLLCFFYDPENCAKHQIVPDQLMTALEKTIHFNGAQVLLVDVAAEPHAIGSFQLDGQQPAHLLLYTEWLHLDPRPILSVAIRYEGEFNLGDIMSWYNDIVNEIADLLKEEDEEDMEEA